MKSIDGTKLYGATFTSEYSEEITEYVCTIVFGNLIMNYLFGAHVVYTPFIEIFKNLFFKLETWHIGVSDSRDSESKLSFMIGGV